MITGEEVDTFLEHFGVREQSASDKLITKLMSSDQILSQSEINLDKFLEHYGVLGQRWGVTTRSRSGSSSSKSEGGSKGSSGKSDNGESKGSSGDAAALRVAKAKTAHLSNDELKKVVERMKLDQQYSELANPRKEGGKAYVGKMLKDSGNKIVAAIAVTAATILVTKALGKYAAKGEAQKEFLKEGYKAQLKSAKPLFPPPKFP